PLSSMSPTFMVSRDRVAVLGTPGGSRISTMVLLGILGYADALDAQQVAALPRYQHHWKPDLGRAGAGTFSPGAADRRRGLRHTLDLPEDRVSGNTSSHQWGNMQSVLWDRAGNQLQGGSDPRNPVGRAQVRLGEAVRATP